MSDAQVHDAQSGIAEAFTHLSEETQMLVRQEMERVRSEMWDRVKAVLPAVGLLAVGGGMGLASAASAYRLVLRILERMSTPGIAAFLATAGFGAGAAVALKAGREQLRHAPLPLPVSSAAAAASDAVGTAEEAVERSG